MWVLIAVSYHCWLSSLHLAVVRVRGVAGVSGVSIRASTIIELWGWLWAGNWHWSWSSTGNRRWHGQGNSEESSEEDSQQLEHFERVVCGCFDVIETIAVLGLMLFDQRQWLFIHETDTHDLFMMINRIDSAFYFCSDL